MIGSLLSVADVNYRKQRLVYAEALGKDTHILWVSKQPNLTQLLSQFIKT